MATGKSMQSTGQVGEYLAVAELCRMGFIATTFTRNVPNFDIIAINSNGKSFPIQVKTINSKSKTWQFSVDDYLNITIENEIQIIHGKKNIPHLEMIVILIKLLSYGKDQFYILQLKDLQEIIYKTHKEYLQKHNGRRPRKPDSKHTAFSTDDVKQFRDNWELIRKEINL